MQQLLLSLIDLIELISLWHDLSLFFRFVGEVFFLFLKHELSNVIWVDQWNTRRLRKKIIFYVFSLYSPYSIRAYILLANVIVIIIQVANNNDWNSFRGQNIYRITSMNWLHRWSKSKQQDERANLSIQRYLSSVCRWCSKQFKSPEMNTEKKYVYRYI